jgi:pyruvate ferredoxin oxidoreductase gamma subunit
VYRIRLHGRGGQGMKTASRILGSAFFAEGFEVQDAPRYGAERRGAPIFAYVRAARGPIHERGPIRDPDLVVVADETLVPVASAGVMVGACERAALLIRSDEPAEEWRRRLRVAGPVFTLPLGSGAAAEQRSVGAACAGAAARLVGVVSRAALEAALREELAPMGAAAVEASLERARAGWSWLEPHAGRVAEGRPLGPDAELPADWVEVPFEPARISAPDVRAPGSSVAQQTGLWRTMRPVVDRDHCHHCHWICTTFCPDGAITPDAEGVPAIDLDHCKGCLVCVAVCPSHAIRAVPEREAAA